MFTKTFLSLLPLLSAVLATPIAHDLEFRSAVDNSSTITVVTYRTTISPCDSAAAIATQTVVSDSCLVLTNGSSAGFFEVLDLDPSGETEGGVCIFTAYTDDGCADSFVGLASEVFPGVVSTGASRCESAPIGDTSGIGSVSFNCSAQDY